MTLNELDKMHISEIIKKTNIDMNEDTIMTIWKKGEKYRTEGSAYWELSNTPGLARKLIEDYTILYPFLFSHEKEIDKFMFLVILYHGYTYNLSAKPNMTQEQEDLTRKGIEGIRELFKGIDETIIFKNLKYYNGPIESLTIIRTKEIAEGITKRKNTNVERLNKLKEEIRFRDVVQSLSLSDVRSITFNDCVGSYMQNMVLYNTLLNKYGQKQAQQLMEEKTIDELIKELDREDYTDELIKALETNIEEINIDKLLLFLAYRHIHGIQDGESNEKNNEEVQQVLETIFKYIQKNPQIKISDEETYSKIEFQNDMKRFIELGDTIIYLSKKRTDELKDKILKGEISLNDISLQEFELIRMTPEELRQITKQNPENYIFLLNNGKNKDSKETILVNIINARKCSITLLRVICEKLDINKEDALNLFENGLLATNEALDIVKGKVSTIITDEALIEKYNKYKSTSNQDYGAGEESKKKETEEQENARIELERYATAYMHTEILGKSPEEIENKSYTLAEKIMGENINPRDVILLYEFNLIDIKFAITLGDKEVKDALIARKTLRLKDAKYLRTEWSETETGKLDDEDIIEILRGQTYEQQIIFMAFVLGEDYNTVNNVSQYLKIGHGITKGKNARTRDRSENNNEGKIETESKNENAIPSKMREPIAKVSLLLAFDPDAIPLEGIRDGHVIIIYPNLKVVCIEKLHKIGRNGEKRNENKAATYFMTKEEFEKYKEEIIKDGRINRRFLIEKWMRNPEHWLAHNGNEYWEKELLQRFGVEKEDSRYSEEDKERIKNLVRMSIRSKTESR